MVRAAVESDQRRLDADEGDGALAARADVGAGDLAAVGAGGDVASHGERRVDAREVRGRDVGVAQQVGGERRVEGLAAAYVADATGKEDGLEAVLEVGDTPGHGVRVGIPCSTDEYEDDRDETAYPRPADR